MEWPDQVGFVRDVVGGVRAGNWQASARGSSNDTSIWDETLTDNNDIPFLRPDRALPLSLHTYLTYCPANRSEVDDCLTFIPVRCRESWSISSKSMSIAGPRGAGPPNKRGPSVLVCDLPFPCASFPGNQNEEDERPPWHSS